MLGGRHYVTGSRGRIGGVDGCALLRRGIVLRFGHQYGERFLDDWGGSSGGEMGFGGGWGDNFVGGVFFGLSVFGDEGLAGLRRGEGRDGSGVESGIRAAR